VFVHVFIDIIHIIHKSPLSSSASLSSQFARSHIKRSCSHKQRQKMIRKIFNALSKVLVYISIVLVIISIALFFGLPFVFRSAINSASIHADPALNPRSLTSS
jgi:thiosulfate reductase cytochrome b subunit